MKYKNLLKIAPFIIWPIIASGISFLIRANILESVVLFLTVPAIYLSFLMKRVAKKALLFSLVTILPLSIIWDYIAHFTHQWTATTIFPFRILGLVPVEDILWGISINCFVILFYEYFLESRREDKSIWHPRMKFLSFLFIALSALFFILYFFSPNYLNIPYSYFWIATFALFIPSLVELFRRPKLFQKFILVGAYFFFVNLIYEITALKLGQWTFPSTQYVGWVYFLGVQFPFEELFFLITWGSIAALSYYEPFDDDEK